MGLTPDQRPWLMAQDKKQVVLFDRTTNKTVGYSLDAGFVKNIDHFFIDEQDVIWCAENTLLRSYDLKTGLRKDYPFPSRLVVPNGRSRVLCIIQDRFGRLWVGGGPGLLRFDKQTATFHDTGVQAVLGSLLEDSKGNIWGGDDNQVWLIRNGTEQAEKILLNQTVSPENAGYAFVWRIAEDPAGRIWLATLQGIRLYDPGTRRFDLYRDDVNRLPLSGDDIQSDPDGYLWISNGNRLLRFHPDKKTLQSYGYKDGLPKNALLLLNATMKDRTGTLFFNTTREMFSVNTHQVSTNDKQAPLVISSLRLFNKVVRANDETGILTQDVSRVKEIVFRHDQNIFSLDFALLSFARSHQNKYRYRLDGFDKEWNDAPVPSATYMNLPPGTYTFLVEAANGDGYRNPKPLQLKITVRPPWWKTWYAYLSYLLLTALIVYTVTRFFWLRSSFRRENALNQAKLDFFTNVSHEIRTHLSLISGPLERVYEQFKTGKNIENNLNYARNNSDRLMLLVNELLDFRKIQSGNVRLQVQAYDVVKIIKSVLSAFEHLAKEKDIETVLVCPETEVRLWFDVAQMQKVFYNLLSNAYKFTPDGGKVRVCITETPDEVHISVEDNGKGIAKEYLAQLFTYYYQADSEKPGYGIGLALSKKIVEQHRGRLTAESRPASGPEPGSTVLAVHLRQNKRHFSPDEIKSEDTGEIVPVFTETAGVTANGTAERPQTGNTILVIEDNDELRAFIRELLGGKFNTLEASNGLQGLELAREHIPDLVLCDVMMPGMNGLEVCSELKNTTATAHIPVVLLTARTQNEQIIEGLASGADDYLTKPFDPRILELKIDNAIRVRDNLMERYRRSLFQEQDSGDSLARDLNEAFIARLKTLVAENISDPDFGVNELAREMAMSVSALYRKLRSLTGMTVNDFVKSIRFNEARKLLESGVYLVSEVATMIGFEDNRYFSREFKKIFGKNPNEIRNPVSGAE
ncbi:hypothetical protein GCM10023091_29500 [Ravibacter arvi]|uniref:histidine kinase n=1 Tax=Ravibacter arvi TaxID=2051041 RepID=A0ABP8M3P3_9BACT